MASPIRDVAFDSASYLVPRFESDVASLNCLDAVFDLGIPRLLGVRVRGAIQACEQFGREFCTRVVIESERIGQYRCHRLRHMLILRLGSPANKGLQPPAAGVIMSRG